uniref:A kinase (PRKA) interacting protein 1 n=1 Tax=Gasterosteus aculeatus aculeatus TaxID=481459 RepID=G3NTF1_GASAC
MANQAWLESSLRRSASLGQEVLQRASRRRVDWTSTGVSQTPSTTDEDSQIPVKRAHTELDDVFAALAGLMAQTTHQCKRFYESGCGCEPSDAERSHVSRFHSRPSVVTTSARKHAKVPRYKARSIRSFQYPMFWKRWSLKHSARAPQTNVLIFDRFNFNQNS